MKRKLKQFWLVIVDEDRKEFSVEGPLANDDPWNEAVCRAQEQGRGVRCYSSTIEEPEENLRRTCLSRGYKEAQSPIVLPKEWLD